MSHGLQIYDDGGRLRLDISDSCLHYRGSVSKYYGNTKYTDPITCPNPYNGRYLCVIVVDSLYGLYPPSIETRSIETGNTLYIEAGYWGYLNTIITVHFLGF